MADPAASVVAIAGAVSEGKSAVRDTVLKAFEVLGHIGKSLYVDSWVVRCRRAGMLIVETIENWIFEKKLRAKRHAKLEKTILFKSLNNAAAKGNVSRANRSSLRTVSKPASLAGLQAFGLQGVGANGEEVFLLPHLTAAEVSMQH